MNTFIKSNYWIVASLLFVIGVNYTWATDITFTAGYDMGNGSVTKVVLLLVCLKWI